MNEDLDQGGLKTLCNTPNVPCQTKAGQWETVNLNSVIAEVQRQAGLPAGSIILRMEELPEVQSMRVGLQLAIVQLLQFMCSGRTGARVYCSIKLQHAPSDLGLGKDEAVRVVIQSSAPAGHLAADQFTLLQQLSEQFMACNIRFSYQEDGSGGWLFRLAAIAASGR